MSSESKKRVFGYKLYQYNYKEESWEYVGSFKKYIDVSKKLQVSVATVKKISKGAHKGLNKIFKIKKS